MGKKHATKTNGAKPEELVLTVLEPADFPNRAAVCRFILSPIYEALSFSVRSALSPEIGRGSRLTREAAFFAEQDLCALAEIAAGDAKTVSARTCEDFGAAGIQHLEALYMCAIANGGKEDCTHEIAELIERRMRLEGMA